MKNNIVVIIVTYNGEKYIQNCLDSLLRQRWKNFRVLIVDNSSTDTTLECIKKYQIDKRIIVLKNDKNLGFAKANNIGIRFSLEKLKPDHMLLLNQDTVVQDNLLEQFLYWHNKEGPAAFSPKILIKKNRRIWWIGTKIFSKSELLKKFKLAVSYHVDKEKPDFFVFSKPIELEAISGCTLFLPKEIINTVGLFDERFFMYMEDLDYSLRMRKMGYKLLLIPNTVVLHDVHLESEALFREQNVYKTLCRYGTHIRSSILVLIKHFSKTYIALWVLRIPIAVLFEILHRVSRKL